MANMTRAAARLTAIADATEALQDTESTQVIRDLAQVLTDPEFRAEWLTDEMLAPIADAVNHDPVDV